MSEEVGLLVHRFSQGETKDHWILDQRLTTRPRGNKMEMEVVGVEAAALREGERKMSEVNCNN